MILLNDDQMQEFIVKGFVTVHADFPRAFHESIRSQAESIFAIGGNPGNDILPRVPELAELFAHPAVTGALTSILGPCYAMHAHRHCDVTPPNRPATASPPGQLRGRPQRAPSPHMLGNGLLLLPGRIGKDGSDVGTARFTMPLFPWPKSAQRPAPPARHWRRR